jgi:hypothetical protein
MTSAWEDSPDLNDRADGQSNCADGQPDAKSSEGDQDQLEMFKAARVDGADPRLPPAAELVRGGGDPNEHSSRRRTDMTVDDRSTAGPTPGPTLGLHDDANGADPDELRRLENSIRWLMKESGRHLPRAATLPPVRGLPLIENDPAEGASRNAVSLPLDPDRLFSPRPPDRRSGVTRGAVKLLIASAIAAPVAYSIAVSLRSFDSVAALDSSTVSSSFEARLAALMPASTRQSSERSQSPDRIGAEADPIATRAISSTEARPAEAPNADAVKTAAAVPAPSSNDLAAPPPASAASTAVAASNPQPNNAAPPPEPTISAKEIAALLERGRSLFDAGDFAAARLFFRRAANAGDASAALAMGSTYDPDVLAKRFVRGMGADLEEARAWYEKARALGSPEGPRRLETLLAHR